MYPPEGGVIRLDISNFYPNFDIYLNDIHTTYSTDGNGNRKIVMPPQKYGEYILMDYSKINEPLTYKFKLEKNLHIKCNGLDFKCKEQ